MDLLVIVTLRECAGTGGDYQAQGASMSVYSTNFPRQAGAQLKSRQWKRGCNILG